MVLRRASTPEVKAAVEALLAKEESDPGGKALHSASPDEDDEMLAKRLRHASIKVNLAPRQEARSRSEARSDVAAVDEAERRSTVTSSKPPRDRATEGRAIGAPSAVDTEEPAKRQESENPGQQRRLQS